MSCQAIGMTHWRHFPIEEMVLAGETQEDVSLSKWESLDCFFKKARLEDI